MSVIQLAQLMLFMTEQSILLFCLLMRLAVAFSISRVQLVDSTPCQLADAAV